MYLAMARVAEREGYPEIAEAYKRYAYEEEMCIRDSLSCIFLRCGLHKGSGQGRDVFGRVVTFCAVQVLSLIHI